MVVRRQQAFLNRDETIKSQVRRTKDVIYGSQALRAQIPSALSREPGDYDILSRAPVRRAEELHRTLDRQAGTHTAYVKKLPASTYYTRRVMFINEPVLGRKGKNVKVADYGRFKNVPTTNIQGVRYATIDAVQKSKMHSRHFPERKTKDTQDLNIIKLFKRIRGALS